MSTLFTLLLWGGGVALLVFILALVVSWRVQFCWRSDPDPEFAIKVNVLSEMMPALTLKGRRSTESGDPPKRAKKASGVRKRSMSLRSLSAVLECLASIIANVRIEEANVSTEFGFEDPADTGYVFGLLAPLSFSGATPGNLTFRAYPNFNACCLNGAADLSVRVTPIRLAGPIARLAWRLFGARR
jgi:hypothetical protein